MDAAALFHEANRLLESGDLSGAERRLRQAIALDEGMAETHANLAFVLEQQGELEEAETCYRQALALDPLCAQVHMNLGTLLSRLGRFEPAREAYLDAIELDPEGPAAWSNLGVLYVGVQREEEAEQCLRHALVLDADYAKARFNLSYLLLRQERYGEGWTSLEARDWYQALARHLQCPRWQGEPLAGRSLLVSYEAGHGDVIQFCRYAAMLKARGAGPITLLCHPALKTLLVTLQGVDQVLAFDEEVATGAWDLWTPLLSLPLHCGTRADTIPAQLPYLSAPPALQQAWRARLPADGLRVGLVWKGNPKFDNDADRSLHGLDWLLPLGAVPGVRFISLQKGAGEDEARHPPVGLELLELGTAMSDFADAAAILSQLDLLISVDTAMAHLAGALAKPCWLLLPAHMTDWRWGKERVDSPWYPGVMRLFRQTERGDWGPVVAALMTALQDLVQAEPCKQEES